MAFSRFSKKPSSAPILSSSSSVGLPLLIIILTLRFLQFVFAITVCGLYGTDLHKAHKEDKYKDSKWVYAVVVGALSAVSAIVYAGFRGKDRGWASAWDVILLILWIAVFGVFGKLYIHENPEGDSGIKRMKNAVWIDLVNMLLWLISALVGVVLFLLRGRRSLHTGRAAV